jgi:hypothetical protein
MRIQAGDIFVNSLEGLLFSTPLLLSPINARGGDGIIAVGLPRGLRAADSCARRPAGQQERGADQRRQE